MENLSREELEQALMNVRLFLANIENYKYVLANAEYLDKSEVTNALKLVLADVEPVMHSIQMHTEMALIIKESEGE